MMLTVLGSSGSVPGPGNPCSGYLVEHDGYRLLLDLGTGAFGELLRHRAAEDVDAVVVSHLHSDHVGDLASLAYAQEQAARRTAPTVVVAPEGAAPGMSRAGMFELRAARAGAYVFGPFHIVLARVRHQVETYAVRVGAGSGVLAYTGDSGPCRELVAAAEGADVLLAEAALGTASQEADWTADGSAPAPYHLTAGQAGELARRAGAGLLVLTTVRPWHSEEDALAAAARRCPNPALIARPGLRLSLTPTDRPVGDHE
jgi:ribonuclease BN (tRNA processing enzyme)